MPNSPSGTAKQKGAATAARSAAVEQPLAHTGAPPAGTHAEPIHRRLAGLQRNSGNQAVSRAIAANAIPAGIPVGMPGDRHEQEAARVARQVMSGPKRVDARTPAFSTPASVPQTLTGGGPLGAADRTFFEERLGTDLTNVRIHSGEAARDAAQSVQAKAFTVGQDIVFGNGQYAPGTPEGRRLLAHELTHVVQQSGAANLAGITGRTATPMVQREPDGSKPATEQQPTEREMILHAADRARKKPHDPTVMFLSAAEIVYRLIHLECKEYEDLISGVGYSELPPPVLAVGRQWLSITVSRAFVLGTTADTLSERASELRAKLAEKAPDRAAKKKSETEAGQRSAEAQSKKSEEAVKDVGKVEGKDAPAPAADAQAGPELSKFRQAILGQLKGWAGEKKGDKKGAKEGDPGERGELFRKFHSDALMESNRVASARIYNERGQRLSKPVAGHLIEEPINGNGQPIDAAGNVIAGREHEKYEPKPSTKYTSCVDFLLRIQTDVGGYKLAPINTYAETQATAMDAVRAKKPGGKEAPKVWHMGNLNMKERPKPGDIYMLGFQEPVNQFAKEKPKPHKPAQFKFAHIGFIKSIKKVSEDLEIWETVDGGQGKGLKYDEYGKKPADKKGEEELCVNEREYTPSENLISGEANHGPDRLWLEGWVDVDLIPQNEEERQKLNKDLMGSAPAKK